MQCDILAGDQGPSCVSVSQIPNINVIHVRFIRKKQGINCNDLHYSGSNDIISPPKKQPKISVDDEIQNRQLSRHIKSNPTPTPRLSASNFQERFTKSKTSKGLSKEFISNRNA